MAGAIVMYDRVKSMAAFAERPVREGGPQLVPHVSKGHGKRKPLKDEPV
jgi:hypothetical protein